MGIKKWEVINMRKVVIGLCLGCYLWLNVFRILYVMIMFRMIVYKFILVNLIVWGGLVLFILFGRCYKKYFVYIVVVWYVLVKELFFCCKLFVLCSSVV